MWVGFVGICLLSKWIRLLLCLWRDSYYNEIFLVCSYVYNETFLVVVCIFLNIFIEGCKKEIEFVCLTLWCTYCRVKFSTLDYGHLGFYILLGRQKYEVGRYELIGKSCLAEAEHEKDTTEAFRTISFKWWQSITNIQKYW